MFWGELRFWSPLPTVLERMKMYVRIALANCLWQTPSNDISTIKALTWRLKWLQFVILTFPTPRGIKNGILIRVIMHTLSFPITVKHDHWLTSFKHNISYAWNAARTVVDCFSVLCSDAIFFAVNKQNKVHLVVAANQRNDNLWR